MSNDKLDRQIREYFMGQMLPEAAVQSVLQQGASPQGGQTTRQWWLTWGPVAIAATVILAFTFQAGRNYVDNGYAMELAGQIAIRHEGDGALEVKGGSFDSIQEGLRELQFSIMPELKSQILSAYEILGARYCQLQGQQAAHLRVKHRVTGALCTLYITSMNGPLAKVHDALPGGESEIDLEAHKVNMWEDSGRLFALVQ